MEDKSLKKEPSSSAWISWPAFLSSCFAFSIFLLDELIKACPSFLNLFCSNNSDCIFFFFFLLFPWGLKLFGTFMFAFLWFSVPRRIFFYPSSPQILCRARDVCSFLFIIRNYNLINWCLNISSLMGIFCEFDVSIPYAAVLTVTSQALSVVWSISYHLLIFRIVELISNLLVYLDDYLFG